LPRRRSREAGAAARRRFLDRSFTVGFKGRQDYLTEVDGETEVFIAQRLLQVFPSDGFIGEESKARPADEGGAAWVVDPIDGTANFARAVPHFCISIASVAGAKVEVGVIYDPMRDELFAGRRGGGARLNGAPIRASDISSLADSAVEVGWNLRASADQFADLLRRVVLTGAAPFRTGSGALALASVAAGRLDGYVESHIKPWDSLAGILLVSEAGGVCERLFGQRWTRQGRPAHRVRAWDQARSHLSRGVRGRCAMTEITLTHGEARATIALLGAEARQWRIAGRDLLWRGDPEIWSDISPILYPVVGWTRDGEERVDGRRYKLGLHGFARFETFAVETSEPDFARLTLADNARTRAVYPFAFALAIEYRLTADALAIAIEVANPGAKRAPYACGLHPGFRWPFGAAGREGALVQFERAERPEVPELAPGGLVRATTRPIPLCGHNLPLSDALFEHDALCFLDCKSRSLAFIDASGASTTMESESFQHAALWTRPGAPFLCLEAWTGYSDPDGFTGDLFDKPGMRTLEPGERARHEARYVFRPHLSFT
jgi:fructose-1,6-bisphosphatase/inositol monophosphatase family enzyme/galactose mutarotase-like enzyme